MLPDTGERYLSTPLFEDITEEMTEEETEISKSTPRYRFDTPPAPAERVEDEERDSSAALGLDAEAEAFVRQTVAREPVVMFALEWCEFCWSVRKLFSKLGIEYTSVDLDAVEYQAGDRGGKIRAALAAKTGAATIPQIFVGGEHVGGCTDLFDAQSDGRLSKQLDAIGVDYRESADVDAYGLLPGWLHPRKAS
jgi:cysteine synthase A